MERSGSFGVWLRQRRTQVLGWTQAELARRVFCSEAMIRKIETGARRPARELAHRLLLEVGVSQEELACHLGWARGLVPEAGPLNGSAPVQSDGIQFSASVDGAQRVLVPLDAVSAFGAGEPTIVQLHEPFMGQRQWVAIPLSSLPTLEMTAQCQEDACNGQDPEVTGCVRESVTVDDKDIVNPRNGDVIGTVELRYSRTCQTNWVRITRLCREERRLQAYLRDEDGDLIPDTKVDVEASRVYGYGGMWYAPTGQVAVQACGIMEGFDEVRTDLY